MDDQAFKIFELIDRLQALHAPEILLGAAVLLILVDYFFPTDVPAHFGYLCLALAAFFIAYQASLAPAWCLAVSLGAWILLAVLHRLVFYQFLSNAHDAELEDDSEPAEASA